MTNHNFEYAVGSLRSTASSKQLRLYSQTAIPYLLILDSLSNIFIHKYMAIFIHYIMTSRLSN